VKPQSTLLLKQIQMVVSGMKPFDAAGEDLVRENFRKILEGGDAYNVADIENWLASSIEHGDKSVCERVMNIAHYQKTKHESKNRLRLVSGGDQCSCGGSH